MCTRFCANERIVSPWEPPVPVTDVPGRKDRGTYALLHELGHVAWHMRLDSHRDDPIMDHGPIGEMGFVLEHMVWGGTVKITEGFEVRPGVLFLKEYPSASLCAGYKYSHLSCTVDPDETSSIDRLWRLLHHWTTSLFRDNYWDLAVAKHGAEALKVPRLCGYVRTLSKWICDEEDIEAERAILESVILRDDAGNEVDTGPLSPCPVLKRKGISACEWEKTPLHYYYDPSDIVAGQEDVDPQFLVPKGHLMLWDGTLIPSTLKDKVEKVLKDGQAQPSDGDFEYAMY
ncbi:hypothetical protein LTR78_004772 [Recurvomyces mirabilis]|uniref:Uncharacterized protein n=1 Tax=Recurvomyces mirabilis TaxID=574656 RepID=A0AAE0WP30_9PEZI|nr:hypothetical protein LTR78_004772 [Recurvomyces mirabilis]KAK5157943.1 hypothetical protein LTS14_003866 [Recurvomyces mirabilis]